VFAMEKIDTLIESISEARRFISATRDRSDTGNDCPERAWRMLSDVRGICLSQSEVDIYLSRAALLLEAFGKLFPECSDVFLIRSPGRVNIIGEHTDYNGLPVLPIAINRDIMLVASPRSDTVVHIHNIDPRFEPRKFNISESIEPCPQGDWGNYAKAAAQSIQKLLSTRGDGPVRGFNAVIGGNIPMASGLASSSALVVLLAIATVLASGNPVDYAELAEVLAEGEQYVGTRGGGMDQTVCLFGQEGRAIKIEFFPVRTEQILLPGGYSFVVCHSMVDAPKTTTARLAYNVRSAESRIAAALLDKALFDITGRREIKIQRIGDLYSNALKLSEAEIDSLIERTFREEMYSLRDVAKTLGIDEEGLCRLYLGSFTGEEIGSLERLRLRDRSIHVLSEGRRVRQAAEELRVGRMDQFGGLMYQSHESCAKDYEISIPELDTLVSIAKEAGALGARLTGAGFGGCVVSLVRDDDIEKFIGTLNKRYYEDYLSGNKLERMKSTHRSDHIFVCKAVNGAGMLFMENL
jgi:N-acetylgalactosamine kinase